MDNEELIKLCAVGDKQAIDLLYRRYGASMLRVIARYVSDGARAEDILHDGFIVILTRIDEVRQPERLEYWMGTVMKNLCIKYLSEVDVLEILENDNEVPDVPPIDDILSYEELQIIINRLPEGYRRIFKLAVLEGKSHKEIGRMLGIAPHSSSSQLHHARLLLQRMITERKRELGIITMLVLASGLWFLIHQSGMRKATDMVARTEQTETVVDSQSVETARVEAPEQSVQPDASGIVGPSAQRRSLQQGSLATVIALFGLGNASAVDTVAAIAPVATIAAPIVEVTDTAALSTPASDRTPETARKAATDTTARRSNPAPRPTAPAVPTNRRTQSTRLLKSTHIAQASGSWSVGIHGTGAAALASGGNGWKDSNNPASPGDNPNKPDSSQTVEAVRPLKVSSDMQQVATRTGDAAEHEIPLTFGFSVGKRVSSRLSVESGATYTLLRTRLNYYGGGMNIVRNVRTNYIGIPLKLNYQLFNHSAFSVYGTVGAAVDIPVGSQFTTRTDKPLNSAIVFPHLSSRIQFSMLGGLGVQYSLNPRVGFYFEPSLRYYFNNHSTMPTYWQDHPWSFSFPIGVRYTW